jgi:hypothetical protein
MKIKAVEKLSEAQFRRIVGVKRATFNIMVTIITDALIKKKTKGGRPNKLDVGTMILMTLEYLREYRTYAAIGLSYGLSESNTYKTIRWVEDILVQCDLFKLPGKKALYDSENEFEILLIDATETPIERPKKNSKNTIQVKRKDIQ